MILLEIIHTMTGAVLVCVPVVMFYISRICSSRGNFSGRLNSCAILYLPFAEADKSRCRYPQLARLLFLGGEGDLITS